MVFGVSNDSKRESCITRGLNIIITKSNRVQFTFSSLTVPKHEFHDSLGTTFVQLKLCLFYPSNCLTFKACSHQIFLKNTEFDYHYLHREVIYATSNIKKSAFFNNW